jgi:hypothetical protein
MNKYLLPIFFISIFLLGVVYFFFTSYFVNKASTVTTNNTKSNNKYSILSECLTPKDEQGHYDVKLHILFLGQNSPIPGNIGIENGCMHHLVTHDTSGIIHVHFAKYYPFTLGDFFSTWGTVFNHDQLGQILTGDRYVIALKVNGKDNNEYENYRLKPHDDINVIITKKMDAK